MSGGQIIPAITEATDLPIAGENSDENKSFIFRSIFIHLF
jgi:hypothetical protein